MKKLKASIFLWASLYFVRSRKSSYEYSLLNSKFQKRKIFYSIFILRDLLVVVQEITER